MRFKNKYVDPALIYLLVYIFGFVLFSVGTVMARYLYAYMNSLLPSLFPIFSPVSEKEEYASYLKLLDTLGVAVAVFLINYFTMIFDNKKFELMISRTEGQYRIAEGLKIYGREFIISDLVSAVVLPLILLVTPYFIPNIPETETPIINILIMILDSFFLLGNTMEANFGIFTTIILTAVFSIASRVILIPHMLKKWRAAWLSGSMA